MKREELDKKAKELNELIETIGLVDNKDKRLVCGKLYRMITDKLSASDDKEEAKEEDADDNEEEADARK